MSGVVADTSAWIEFFAGRPARALEDALAEGLVVLPPLVVAELVSGARPRDRAALEALVAELPLHETPLRHWIGVGALRGHLRAQGVSVSTPDAHVAQCALERDAVLLSRDRVFARVARHTRLRVRLD